MEGNLLQIRLLLNNGGEHLSRIVTLERPRACSGDIGIGPLGDSPSTNSIASACVFPSCLDAVDRGDNGKCPFHAVARTGNQLTQPGVLPFAFLVASSSSPSYDFYTQDAQHPPVRKTIKADACNVSR